MKQTNAIIAIALFIGIFTSNVGSEVSPATGSSFITWTQSALYNAYQGMISSATGLISIPYSLMNNINAWNDQKKVYVTTAAVASLLAVYQKETIKRWFNDMIERLTTPKETRELLKEVNVEEIPWNENYDEKVKGL